MAQPSPGDIRFDDINLVDLNRFESGFPHPVFTLLRREAPVWLHPPKPEAPGGEGFWVLSRHADVLALARDRERFSSEAGGWRQAGGSTLHDTPRGSGFLHYMDPPRHTRIRSLVNMGFTPRAIGRLERDLRERTQRILDAAAEKRELDFVTDVAAELPLQAICGLLGVPQADRHAMFEWTRALVDLEERELNEDSERLRRAAAGLRRYAVDRIAEKRRSPGEDLLSIVVHAEIPGDDGRPDRLTDSDLVHFFILLMAAGSETTRNAIAHGLLALLEHPDQLAWLREDLTRLGVGIEEIVRWTSPVAYNRRTATCDVVLGGQRIRAGDKVTVWWPSANRDEGVFEDPFRFDLARHPNPHVTFGQGEHFCLGANLARMEIRLLYEQLLPRFGSIERTGDVEWARSNKHNGVRHLPVRLAE